jgi:hypothetical protein
MAALITLPLAAYYPPTKGCALEMVKAHEAIDAISDLSRTAPATKQLEIAKNMMDQGDDKGCLTHVDNAVRAIK